MQIKNVDRINVFREVGDQVYTLEEIHTQYKIDPAGTLREAASIAGGKP